MPFPRVSKLCKLLILATGCLLFTLVYFYAPLLEEEWILWKLANYNPNGPASNSGVNQHVPFPKQFRGKQLAFHQIFEPRKVALIDYNYTRGSRPRKGEKKKVILLWTPWNGVWNTINYYFLKPDDASFKQYGCPNSNCWVTRDKGEIHNADAVLFNLLDISQEFPEYRDKKQRWIGYIMEAPWQVDRNLTAVNGLMNWTMSYREDSDIVVKYGFIGKKLKSAITPSIPNTLPAKKKVPFNQKHSVVWFVSDCKTDSRREDYAHELAQYIDVDIYGSCGTKSCFPSQSSTCYEEVLDRYKFYLSFENSICVDYVTEKFFNALLYDAIPVVFGGADYSRIAPQGGYIDAMNYPDPSDLANLLIEISKNENRHKSYHEWKKNYQSYLYPWMCYLCDRLHEPPVTSMKKDIPDWWVNGAECRRWVKTQGFVNLE